ncbi:hypothetical protein [Rivularia sp. UHCC 0363]|uniref:hypothetical protein n=1 Tax=Rivularia sp. UHCC 0363 TaxID=3110244 RepID=UPI002B20442C|nr:hypothetical protein [Rivularia sp. UHCC 0363]MEA5593035.1 hypothetical protein [Rivularia sp. UHCC 0363]
MATSPEPNITAVASIIAAFIAATPPALTAIADVAVKLRGLLQKKRSSPLRVLKIIRKPVDVRYWKKVRRNFLIGILLLLIGILFIVVNTLLYRLGFEYVTLSDFGAIGIFWGVKVNVIVIVNFLFLCFYIIAFAQAYRRLGNNPNDARHFLFKKALLLVEADFKNTINCCQETLKLLGAMVIEFDSETAMIEAYTNNELVTVFGGLYRIKINSQNLKSEKTELEVEFLPYVSDDIVKLTKSSNINRFIQVFTNS